MNIRIRGAGWYGCSIAAGMVERGHDVELFESADHIFAGASGANPARLHQGQHYPRSRLTRAFCQEHQQAFMARYGSLTRGVPVNVYAIADQESLVDFGTYTQILRGEIEYITISNPEEFGLAHVEGAILTGERHIVIREAKAFFENLLGSRIHLNSNSGVKVEPVETWDIDCTFCANDSANIDRYEACVTYLLEGPTDKAVTIMDGPFPSLYPWDETEGLSSLTSAKWTPIKKCDSWIEARDTINTIQSHEIAVRGDAMIEQLAYFWPSVRDLYRIVDYRLGIRAMPKSAADARLVDIIQIGERALRVRAGKIDAVIHAEKMICEMIGA